MVEMAQSFDYSDRRIDVTLEVLREGLQCNEYRFRRIRYIARQEMKICGLFQPGLSFHERKHRLSIIISKILKRISLWTTDIDAHWLKYCVCKILARARSKTLQREILFAAKTKGNIPNKTRSIKPDPIQTFFTKVELEEKIASSEDNKSKRLRSEVEDSVEKSISNKECLSKKLRTRQICTKRSDNSQVYSSIDLVEIMTRVSPPESHEDVFLKANYKDYLNVLLAEKIMVQNSNDVLFGRFSGPKRYGFQLITSGYSFRSCLRSQDMNEEDEEFHFEVRPWDESKLKDFNVVSNSNNLGLLSPEIVLK